MSPQEMVPNIWYDLTLSGLAFSILSLASHHEVPDAIVAQVLDKSRSAVMMADHSQLVYASTELHEWDPQKLPGKLVLVAIAHMMHVAQQVSLVMDALLVERRATTAHHVFPNAHSLEDIFRQVDENVEQHQHRAAISNSPTIAWSDLPTTLVRITDEIVPDGRTAPPPPPPEGWLR